MNSKIIPHKSKDGVHLISNAVHPSVTSHIRLKYIIFFLSPLPMAIRNSKMVIGNGEKNIFSTNVWCNYLKPWRSRKSRRNVGGKIKKNHTKTCPLFPLKKLSWKHIMDGNDNNNNNNQIIYDYYYYLKI